VTFEAEGWPSRILACGRRLLLMYLDARPCSNALDMSGYVLRSLFYSGHAFPMVVVVTFEAEGWPSRILVCGRHLLPMYLDTRRSTAFRLCSNVLDMFSDLCFMLAMLFRWWLL
jgi:hypothetical protein